MLSVLLCVCNSLLSELSLDRVAGILDREASIVEGIDYKYLHTPKAPCLIAFDQERRLAALAMKPSVGASTSTKTLRRKLQGSWHAYPLDVYPIDTPLPIRFTDQYQLSIYQDIMVIDYGLVSQKIFYGSKAMGSLLVTWLYHPLKSDRVAFQNGNGVDLHLGNFLFMNIGSMAISWRKTSTAHLGRLAIYIRIED
jgi:hypothetical protein